MKSKLALLAASVLLLGSCNSDIRLSPGQAYFKSFSYTGNDPVFEKTRLGDGEIFNPILQGSYSDASICRKDSDYYMVTANYTFFPGIPVLHSKDLVNWEQIGYAMSTDQQLLNTSLKADQGIFPPTIRYNKNNDTFYISGTLVGGGGHFIISAKDPAGQWSQPEWLFGLGGVHPSFFFDDNGTSYIVNQGNPNYEPLYHDYKVIWLQEFDLASMKTKGERKIILAGGHQLEKKPQWLETPHIYQKNGKYYLVASEGGSLGNGFSTCVYMSDNVWGPYEHYSQNPIITQRRLSAGRNEAVTSTGHVDMVEAANGDWWAVFQGVRPYSENNDYNQGRETYLYPVAWDGEWPYIIRNGESLASKIEAPYGAKYDETGQPFMPYIPHGNFTYVEHFTSDTLPPQWAHLRTPTSLPIIPNGSEGLIIPLANNNLRSQRHTGFVAFRQMHQYFSAEMEMHFMPVNSTDFAGFAMYLSDQENFQFGVSIMEDTPALMLQRAADDSGEIIKEDIKSKFLRENFEGRIILRVECQPGGFTFKYKFNELDEYETLVDQVPIKYLSVAKSGGFYGVTMGPYASQEEGN